MDLCRRILLGVEKGGELEAGCSEEELVYHVAILKEGGLLDAEISTGRMGLPIGCMIRRLTWEGHEFLDASRDEGLWKKVREKAMGNAASWTFKLIVEALKFEIRQRHGLLGFGSEGQ